MPIADWQFWVVTVLFLIALWRVAKIVLPKKKAGGCGGCGSAKPGSSSSKRVNLTIDQSSARK